MNFLERLTALVKITAPKLKISKFNGFNLLSNIKVEIIINNNDKQEITLPPKKLRKIVKDAVLKEGYILLEKGAQKRIQDFSSVSTTTIFQSTLDFFRGKIPTNDLEILRASLYVKSVYERGESVSELKWQIMQKYGVRGKNIVNLCTAGYFDSVIKPLYTGMSKRSNFTPELFISTYNKIIDHYTFAVFVSNRMGKEELKQEIVTKTKDNKKYGVKSINIHGLGEDNVKKIVDVLSDADIKSFFTQAPEIDSRTDYIIVKIFI